MKIVLLFIVLVGVYMLLKKTKRKNFFLILLLSLFSFTSIIYLIFSSLLLLAKVPYFGNTAALIIAYGVFPFVLLGIIFLFFKNTKIMSIKERRSLSSKLSGILGLNLLVVFILIIYLVAFGLPRSWPSFIGMILMVGLLVDLLFTLYFILYLIYSVFYQLVPVKDEIDYLIVLGAGLKGDKLTPLLKSRVDKAVEYYNKNKHAKIVVSGGQGMDEIVSEAYAMGQYLLSIGVLQEDIILEDKSTTTYENLLFSKKLIMENTNKENPSIYFTTSNYHVLRGALYAKKVGIDAEGIGAPTAYYYLPSALIREFVALIVQYKLFTIINVLLIIAFVIYSYAPY